MAYGVVERKDVEGDGSNVVQCGEPTRILRCIVWLPKQYTETETCRPANEPVPTSPILPRWFSNQWLTDSLVAHPNFHFLQCRARGAKPFPRNVLPPPR